MPIDGAQPPTGGTPILPEHFGKPMVDGATLAGEALIDDAGQRLGVGIGGRIEAFADVKAYLESAIQQVEYIRDADVPKTLPEMRAAAAGELGNDDFIRDRNQRIAMDIKRAHALTAPPKRPRGLGENGYLDALNAHADGQAGKLRADMFTKSFTPEQFAKMSKDEIARIYGDGVEGSALEVMRVIKNGDVQDITPDAFPGVAKKFNKLTDDVAQLSGWLSYDYSNPAVTGGAKGLPPQFYDTGNDIPTPSKFVERARAILPRIDELDRELLNVSLDLPVRQGLPGFVPEAVAHNPVARGLLIGSAAAVALGAAAGGALVMNSLRDGKSGSGDDANGVVVNDHPVLRGITAATGFGLLGGGLTAFAVNQNQRISMRSFPGMKLGPKLLAAAGVGAALAGASALFSAKVVGYESKHADRNEALAAAASRGGDVGIHATSDGKFGLLPLDGQDVDNKGAKAARLGNRSISLEHVVSRDGDWHEAVGGGYVNRGKVGGTTELTAATDPASLVGARLGTDSRHNARTVGAQVGDTKGYDSREAAARDLFEQGDAPHALLQLGDRTYAYALEGGGIDDVHARGTSLGPWDRLTLQAGAESASASEAGAQFARAPLAGESLAGIDAADAKQVGALAGRRIATSEDGRIVRIGAQLGSADGYATRLEATNVAASAGGDHAVLQLEGGRHVVFEGAGDGGRATSMRTPATLLGASPDEVLFQRGNKAYRLDDSRTGMTFVARATPYSVDEPLGQRIGGFNDVRGGAVRRHVRDFATRAEADEALRGRLADEVARGAARSYVVIEGATPSGNFHLYEVEPGASGNDWDQELGDVAGYLERIVDERHNTRTDETWEGQEKVYQQVHTRDDVMLAGAGPGTETVRGRGWQLHESVDYAATNRLQATRAAERAEAARRAAEAEQRRREQEAADAAERARRAAEESSSSSHSSGGGYSSGSSSGGGSSSSSSGGGDGGNGYGW